MADEAWTVVTGRPADGRAQLSTSQNGPYQSIGAGDKRHQHWTSSGDRGRRHTTGGCSHGALIGLAALAALILLGVGIGAGVGIGKVKFDTGSNSQDICKCPIAPKLPTPAPKKTPTAARLTPAPKKTPTAARLTPAPKKTPTAARLTPAPTKTPAAAQAPTKTPTKTPMAV